MFVIPIYNSFIKNKWVGKEESDKCIEYLRERNINNYADYFSDMCSFIYIEKSNAVKYTQERLKPARIVLGSIEAGSGNEFFRNLLDSHPQILSMYYSELCNSLFWICVRLSTQNTDNILPLFWKLMEGDRSIFNREAFNETMEQLLAYKSRYTSQELFVMFHISYCSMYRADMPDVPINNRIIYWEPHHVDRTRLEECVEWLLEAKAVHCDIINVVRNSVMRSGSRIKIPTVQSWGVKGAYTIALECLPVEKKIYAQSSRQAVRFEDLKCNPQETLGKLCDEWNIRWSDILLQTTRRGKAASYIDNVHAVTGFDLQPVYNTYENFYSELDRFRIILINTPWQKKYGYPYVELDKFTRRELQEMLLKKFRFESPGDTTGFYRGCLSLDDRINLLDGLRGKLQEARCLLNNM